MEFGSIENRTMQYVLALGTYRSITKAAESLYISQPALSKFLKNLEENLGFPLFNRFGHTLTPTFQGERFLYYAAESCKLEQQLRNELLDLSQGRGGRLRFAVPIMRSANILSDLVPAFMQLHPDVQLQIREEHAADLVKLITDNKLDFALINRDIQHPNLYRQLIRKDKVYLVVPHGHWSVAKFGAPGQTPTVDISEFQDELFILQNPGQQTREIAEKIFSDANFWPRRTLDIRNIPTAIALTEKGCGISFLAELYLKGLNNSSLYAFQIQNKSPTIDTYLFYQKGIYMPQYFKDFINIVQSVFVSL